MNHPRWMAPGSVYLGLPVPEEREKGSLCLYNWNNEESHRWTFHAALLRDGGKMRVFLWEGDSDEWEELGSCDTLDEAKSLAVVSARLRYGPPGAEP